MSDEPTIEDFLDAAAHFGLPSLELVQKDWHVLRTLRVIAAVDASPFRLVFAGGTCLARAHRLVARMSEDVDFKVVPLDPAPVSRSQRRSQLGQLRDRILVALQEHGFGIEAESVRSRDDNHYILYNLRYADTAEAKSLLRPTIQVELTHTHLRTPSLVLPVSSFVAEAYGREPELAGLPCVSVTETAAEKLVSLTRRTAMELRGLSRLPDPNLVRHIYDLHAINDHIDRDALVPMVHAIAESDAREFENQYPAYLADIAGETRFACTALLTDASVRDRYTSFVDAMVYGRAVDFDAALGVVMSLVDEAWPTP